ncbi:MAG TPA: amidohydrolase family protein [Chloroflexota bacterium]|nr:amidohydrolase family protein [Chloroflexota bacterium]
MVSAAVAACVSMEVRQVINDALVFDSTLHLADLSAEGLDDVRTDKAEMEATVELTNRLVGGLANLDLVNYRQQDGTYSLPAEFGGTIEAMYDWAFERAPMDMALVGNAPVVPTGAILRNPEKYLRFIAEMRKAHPERLLFGGGTDPSGQLGGTPNRASLRDALESIELQITEYGASSIKFYPVGWRCDDQVYAYPLYEKARSLGVNVIQFHKNLPTLRENVESQGPHDLQAVSRDFPDMTILLHHPLQLYFFETVSIAQRNPNVYLVCTPLIQYSLYRPRLAQELFGHLLHEVGSEKLIWGSEGVLVGNPTRILDAFSKLEIPQDLREGYGFPQFTEQDKANILGATLATVFGIDVEDKKRELAALPAGR